jgi:hypothetical protein
VNPLQPLERRRHRGDALRATYDDENLDAVRPFEVHVQHRLTGTFIIYIGAAALMSEAHRKATRA